MRPLRLATLVLATLCLAAVPSTAAGQDARSDAPDSEVTPTEVSGSYAFSAELMNEQDYYAFNARAFMDDPRVSGDMVVLMHGQHAADADSLPLRYVASVRITNEGGAWEGPLTGIIFADGHEANYGWLAGEGGYDGLSYFGAFEEEGGLMTGRGIIWSGEPPTPPALATLDEGVAP